MTLNLNTHPRINSALVGAPTALAEGEANASLLTTDAMVADDRGLVHGGFVFGLADYAAMLAVNDPNVVLGQADVRFLAPVRVGQRVEARARVVETDRRKRIIEVGAVADGVEVLAGTMVAFVLDKHVLDRA